MQGLGRAGFADPGRLTGRRRRAPMLTRAGNPRAGNLLDVICIPQEHGAEIGCALRLSPQCASWCRSSTLSVAARTAVGDSIAFVYWSLL